MCKTHFVLKFKSTVVLYECSDLKNTNRSLCPDGAILNPVLPSSLQHVVCDATTLFWVRMCSLVYWLLSECCKHRSVWRALLSRQREQRTLPDRTGQRGQRTAAAWSSRAGYTQGPRPRLLGPWALIFAVLGVLMLVSSRRESWLKKTFLVARKRPRGTWLGKSRQDPPGQVQYAACWWGRGALEERGSLASTRCPQELAPWSAWPLDWPQAQRASDPHFFPFPSLFPLPTLLTLVSLSLFLFCTAFIFEPVSFVSHQV